MGYISVIHVNKASLAILIPIPAYFPGTRMRVYLQTPHRILSLLVEPRLLVHLHRVISIKRRPSLLQRDASPTPRKELSPDLRGNLVMSVAQEEIQQSLSLILCDVVLVPLGKCKHALVEEDGQRPGAGALDFSDHRRIANEVKHQRVHALPCCGGNVG